MWGGVYLYGKMRCIKVNWNLQRVGESYEKDPFCGGDMDNLWKDPLSKNVVLNTTVPILQFVLNGLFLFVLQNPHTLVCCISVFSPFCVCLVWPHGNYSTCDDSSLPRSSLSSFLEALNI